jgi:hypothetical protein
VLLIAVIVWLVVIGALSIWVGLRGWALYGRVRALQSEVERQVPRERIDEINIKVARLKEKQAVLQAAVADMQESLHHLSFVTTTGKNLVTPLLVLRYAIRRK